MPFASQTLGLFINKEIFRQDGLKPPTTWDEFLSRRKALKDKGIIPLANGTSTAFMVEIFAGVFTTGVSTARISSTTWCPARRPSRIRAMSRRSRQAARIARLHADRLRRHRLSDLPAALHLGTAAMFAGGSFEIANFRTQNPNLKMDFIAPPAAKAGDARLVTLYLRRRLRGEREVRRRRRRR